MTTETNPLTQENLQHFPLSKLRLDPSNPRLGVLGADLSDQTAVLDAIVERFGVDDVLSSISVNGYFESEPIIGVEENGSILILEGNRRLAACLILEGDSRAANQQKRTMVFQKILQEHKQAISNLPVLVYDKEKDRDKLLPYLGVRHIAGAQPWDSYAKAAWVARVLEQGDLTVAEISRMIGDEHRTVARFVDGFYLVNQLKQEGYFDPEQSLRPGKGSNPEFPFSWIYTALGFAQIRSWLDLGDISKPSRTPIPPETIENGGRLMRFLFGNKMEGISSVIRESREISKLAKLVKNPEYVRYLEQGKTVLEVEDIARPSHERATDALIDVKQRLETVFALLGSGELRDDQVTLLLRYAEPVSKLARNILLRLREMEQP